MSLGTKLTGYLLLGVLVVMGLELYLSVKRIQTDLLHDVRREVAALSRTLHIAVTLIARTDTTEQYFASFVARLSDFENMLDVVFYDHAGQVVARSTPLEAHQLPDVNIHQVITTRTPAEGLFRTGRVQRSLSVNALQAVGPAGRVALRTRVQPAGQLSPAGHIEVEVADTGPGIPADDLLHIFEPFFTTKELTGGTGLGLAISREIVRSHHGEIRVESLLGHGTRFIVSLPLAREVAA